MTFWDKLHAFPKGIQWSPYGESIPIGHLFGEGATGIWKTGLSLNHRWVERITCPMSEWVDYITVDETTPIFAHPRGRDRGRRVSIGHFDKTPNAMLVTGTSRNHRPVTRCTDHNGVLQTYRIFRRKSVKLNRLPRGSKRRTGVWNGQNVADMVSQ